MTPFSEREAQISFFANLLLADMLDLLNVCDLLVQLRESLEASLFVRRSIPNDPGVVLVQAHADSWLVEEHLVDLLERASGSLNTEEPGQWHERGADDAPNPEIVATTLSAVLKRI